MEQMLQVEEIECAKALWPEEEGVCVRLYFLMITVSLWGIPQLFL